jgi:peptidoglycan-N-acetylglucosamine deacetylase
MPLASRQMLQKLARLPLSFVVAFDVAALLALALAVTLLSPSPAAHAPGFGKEDQGEKRIAISFDDAPRGPGALLNPDVRAQMLIAGLKRAGVEQAAFFTNPGRIGPVNAATLQAYARAGHVLANHTAHHLVLSEVSADQFLADIDAAEKWLKPEPGYRPWFRFPQLDEGKRNVAKRDAVRIGLKARGLRDGYVTADGWDWYLESLTLKAVQSGKKMDADGLRNLYVENHVLSADFADDLAKRILGRSPQHVLLLHETDLAAMYVEDLVKALRADGWTIVTADAAYSDPIGKLPPPEIADTNGTLIQMLAWEHHTTGARWFERNNRDVMDQLFSERVLRAN